MGRFVKNSQLSSSTITADAVLVNQSPVLTEANSTFDDTLYVAKNGNDNNNGMSLATPFKTIKAAMQAAAIMVETGPPLGVGNAGAARRVAVRVASGNYTEDNPVIIPRNTALMGDNLRTVFIDPENPASTFFYLNGGCYIWGITVRNYEAVCFELQPAADPLNPPFVPVSPYIQNITSRTSPNGTPNAVCVLIDGSDTITNNRSSKAMILGFMTIFNHGGTALLLKNKAYSQAVNIYTLFCEVGIKIETGSFMTLNGSDCSCGTYGIWADGKTEIYSGTVVGNYLSGVTQLTVDLTDPEGEKDVVGRFPRTNNGILLGDDPNIYFISTFAPDPIVPDRWTLNITSRTRSAITNGESFTGYAVSTVSASAQTMEYVGSGTNPTPVPILSSDGSTMLPPALPQYGGIPVPENEIIETDGGRVNFTSTDQKGDFRIGTGLSIVRATGTIEGDDFNRSLFAIMTPYILSIEGGD
jgi:hypothetical protein